MMVTVCMTVEEYRELERLALHRTGHDGSTLLRCFVGDLTHSSWTGGSDERLYAHQWLDRRYGPEWMAAQLYHQVKGQD